ncbi:MAG: DUF1858 domain-containing protein [Candidatus Diapherotrites archaeon]|nr:DUF1858 domain-containing protein [Candidatus Diapherotrites archaeon]
MSENEKLITADQSIMEVVQKYPQTIKVFVDNGMGCIGCAAANFENIEQGANAHGIAIEEFIEKLNIAANEKQE